VLIGSRGPFESSRQVFRVEPEGTGIALVCDATASVDEVEAIGPAGVRIFNPVVKAIDDSGKFDAQLAYANTSYRRTLLLVARATEKHFVANVALHSPDVSGVRLENIDGVKIYLPLVLLRQLVQGGNLPPKWRSSIAAENQHDRFVSPE
jgi:hypothetical protein